MPAAAPLRHRLEQLSPGDWSFLITQLGTILGAYLAIRSLPISIESVGSSLSRGVDRRKFSRFAIRRNEFLWTAASCPRQRSLIASKTLLWMGAAAALRGLKSSVVNGEEGDGCQWPGLFDCLLRLPLTGLR
ncbi:hypothetical protein CDAR_446541 [Caerostris darwini]|uniref:Uncharacterized protein n=1 Tax=Caerostris darwini TaxID=1538125 RepID=A0AAV4PRZ8_9ARAC|nr:hypothetical protein CDAR_446541 [Caerostris darwini]